MTERRYTFCRICEPHCPLVAEIDETTQRVTGLRPDPEHPVGGTACHKGLNFLDVHHDPDRLNWPLKRTNRKTDPVATFERADWESAIADIGARLKDLRTRFGADSIATYVGNPAAFNASFGAMLMPFLDALDTRMTFCASTQDSLNKATGSWAVYGAQESLPIPDIYNTEYLLCIGANPRVSHWTLVATPSNPDILKDIKRRGGKVVFVNPREIETSTGETGDTLRIIPGTDAYFLAAILHEIDRTQGFADPIVARYGKNVEALREFVGRYPAERVAKIVGIDAQVIRSVAADLIAAGSAAVYVSLGVNQSRQGQLCFLLAEMINFVTGNLGRRGGTLKPPGLLEHFGTHTPASFATSIGTFRVFDPPIRPAAMPGAVLADLIEAGDIKALVVFAGNPLLTIGGEEKLRAALGKLDLLVILDIYRNATGEFADYVLPTADWLEREDLILLSSGMQSFPYVQHTEAMEQPAGERRTEAWIMARILDAAGLPAPPSSAELAAAGGLETSLIDMLLGMRDLSVEKLRAMPHSTFRFDDLPPESLFERALNHADRKVDCFPQSFVEAGLFDLCEEIFGELEREPDGALKLIMMRTPYMHNTWLSNVDRLRSGKQSVNPLHMCEPDAAARGLHNGDRVRVHNGYGEVVTRLEITDKLRPGVVALSHGYGHAKAPGLSTASGKPGVNFNRLAPSGIGSFETISNVQWLTALPVEVELCETPDQSPAERRSASA